jgi:putative ABC transport system substrate-binding protein
MRRRDFITLIGGGVAALPLTAHAQQPGKLPTIGILGGNASVWSPWTSAFVGRLRELGWIDGQTIAIEYRWDEGRPERDAEIATEFVRLNVDAIVTTGAAVPTLKRATSVIPIVFAIANDPVESGLVTSLVRPGGNVTGLSLQATDLAGKRLEFLRAVTPGLRRLAIIFNADYPGPLLESRAVQVTARGVGLEVAPLEIRREEDIAPALDSIKSRAEALYLVADPLVAANRTRIITLALSARLPTMFNSRDHVKAGGLISYGPNFLDLFRRAAELVDRILKGTKPADIPVEQPTKFDLVINLTTAKALGLTIPESTLLRADEVIE